VSIEEQNKGASFSFAVGAWEKSYLNNVTQTSVSSLQISKYASPPRRGAGGAKTFAPLEPIRLACRREKDGPSDRKKKKKKNKKKKKKKKNKKKEKKKKQKRKKTKHQKNKKKKKKKGQVLGTRIGK